MRHHPDAVLIFAAGHGTRMRPLSLDRPKALVQVAGRPLIDHALAQTEAVRPSRIVVNTHAHADQLQAHLAGKRGIETSHEPVLLDTGGGLRAAGPLLGEGPVYTLNSDAAWAGDSPLATLRDHWRPAQMDALLLLVPAARAKGREGGGDFACDSAGRITWPGDAIYTGAQIIRPDLLADCPDQSFSMWWLWKRLAERGRMFGCVYPGHWADVGTPQGIPIAESMLGWPHV